MTSRETEARTAVDEAWCLMNESPSYAIARVQFLRTLMPMLEGLDWKPNLLELKTALSAPEVHMIWTMEPVLEHLKPRLGEEQHALLAAVLAAIGSRSKLKDLDANPIWRSVCGSEPSSSATEHTPPPPSVNADRHLPPAGETGPSETAADEADKFTFGTVVKTSGDCVTIRQYNFARDADEEVDYQVNDATEFGNVTKAGELKPGDRVVVDFTESGGQNLVVALVKETDSPTPL
jgi:hypothetical protein